jgi:hypothetical protein
MQTGLSFFMMSNLPRMIDSTITGSLDIVIRSYTNTGASTTSTTPSGEIFFSFISFTSFTSKGS